MKQPSIYLLGLVIAVAFVHIEAERTVIHPGGNFIKLCTAEVNSPADEDRLVQFFRDRVHSKVFGSEGESNDLRVISNNTEVDPLIIIKTDRFTVTKNGRGYYVLEIKNVTDSDSAWYGCRIFNKLTGSIDFAEASKELLVPGPIRSLFWTSNYKVHMLNSTHSDKYKIEDGGQVLVNNTWLGSSLGCGLLVCNVEPTINITIGKPGEEGSIDITSDFQERSSSL